MLDKAFETLNTLSWGADPGQLAPIDQAIAESHGDANRRKELEQRLLGVLQSTGSYASKDYICRKLKVIGTAASVPALASLLPDDKHSHLARYALESMPIDEAAAALRDALPTLKGELKIGVLGSLGVRQDSESATAIAESLGDQDTAVACAAAKALGAIRSATAAKVLSQSNSQDKNVQAAMDDSSLACAEQFLSHGNKTSALAIYRKLSTGNRPKHVVLAAKRGVLNCLSSKA